MRAGGPAAFKDIFGTEGLSFEPDRFLKPDGLLTSVMSAGVSFRDNRLTQDFRDMIRARGGDIEALPEGAFKAYGTMVNTIIATIPGGA